jgi:hypothetical protein
MKTIAYPILVIFFILTFLSCGDDNDNKFFSEDKTYRHGLKTPEECEELHAAGHFFNCYSTLSLYSDGRANYMVTDIMQGGTYNIKGKTLILKLDQAIETNSVVKFEIKNENQLIGLEDDSVWELY